MQDTKNNLSQYNGLRSPIPAPPGVLQPKVNQPPARPQRKSSLLVAILFLIVVLSAVGFTAVLATRIYDPLWNPFRPKPEKVLHDMILKMNDVKSLNSKMDISFNIPSQQPGQIALSFNGTSDMNDKNNLKGELDITISAKEDSGAIYSLKVGLKMLGKDVYFKLVDYSATVEQALTGFTDVELSKIKNIWIKFPTEEFLSAQSQDQNAFADIIQQKIIESNIYSVKEQLPDVDGKYHYLVKIDNEKLIILLDEVIKTAQEQMQGDGQALPESNIFVVGIVKGIVSEFLNKVGEIDMEFLIGKKDNLLYNFKLVKAFDFSKLFAGETGVINFRMNIADSKFNEKLNITAPVEFKEFDSVFPEVKNSQIKNNIDTIKQYQTEIKKSSGSYVISPETDSFFKSMLDSVKQFSEIFIYQSKYSYCAFAKLVGDTEKYYCISTYGVGRETTTNPSQTGYCTGKTYICPK